MKMFNLICPRCGKSFYGDITMVNLRVPDHCPGCGNYIEYAEYQNALGGDNGMALARLRRPLTEENMYELVYKPEK